MSGTTRDVSDLVARALDAQVQDSFTCLHTPSPQKTQFLAADTVIEEGGENRAIPRTLQRLGRRASGAHAKI
jgi:hypothetical protein